jgi:hypothetical protein
MGDDASSLSIFWYQCAEVCHVHEENGHRKMYSCMCDLM